jgi:glycosyltransferase involved in cell wall biosynthesis
MIATLLPGLQSSSNTKVFALSLNAGILSQRLKENGIETIVIPEGTHSFLSIAINALSVLKGKGIEIIHTHGYKQDLLGFVLGKLLGIDLLISTIHGLPEPGIMTKSGALRRRCRALGRTLLNYFLLSRSFRRVIAVSQSTRNVLLSNYGLDQRRVEVIYNGIDSPKVTQDQSRQNNLSMQIGTVGRMVPVKDFDLFLEVAAELSKHVHNVGFSILGDGPLKFSLVNKAKHLRIDNLVRFENPQPDPTHYYQTLDIYLNTSLYEGHPLSVLEAMFCGKPVVAARVGGICEIISHGEQGFLVEYRKPKDFAKYCLLLLQDAELRIKMGESARKKVAESFNLERMIASYYQLYKSLNGPTH